MPAIGARRGQFSSVKPGFAKCSLSPLQPGGGVWWVDGEARAWGSGVGGGGVEGAHTLQILLPRRTAPSSMMTNRNTCCEIGTGWMEMISGFFSVSRSSPVITPQAEAVPRTSGTTTAHGECLLDFHDAPLTAFCQCVQKQQVPQSPPRTSVELFPQIRILWRLKIYILSRSERHLLR